MLNSEVTKIVFNAIVVLESEHNFESKNIVDFHVSENEDNDILAIIEVLENEKSYQIIIAIDDNKLVIYKETENDCIILEMYDILV